jgi:hypothetical protein
MTRQKHPLKFKTNPHWLRFMSSMWWWAQERNGMRASGKLSPYENVKNYEDVFSILITITCTIRVCFESERVRACESSGSEERAADDVMRSEARKTQSEKVIKNIFFLRKILSQRHRLRVCECRLGNHWEVCSVFSSFSCLKIKRNLYSSVRGGGYFNLSLHKARCLNFFCGEN